jgi:hypothetical protein
VVEPPVVYEEWQSCDTNKMTWHHLLMRTMLMGS